ncbi:MAG: hypothetical protein VYC39_10240 [Myxococcota bacterium]|nr:hypothetical protein [Myxococcota bacterium]
MNSIPRLPPNFGAEPVGRNAAEAPAQSTGTIHRTNSVDRFESIPRHRTADESNRARGNFFRRMVDNPAVRATLMGAGGLASVLGGLVAPQVANAAPVNHVPNQSEVDAPKSVVFIGMNEGANHEVRELRKKLGHDGVSFVKPSEVQDVIRHENIRYDLNNEEDVKSFVASLGITGERADALTENIHKQTEDGKDELAKFVILLNEAEMGERTIERLVFSGHSVGSGVWGDENGELKWRHLKKTMDIFPKASGQVEDVLLAACYSGGQNTMKTYRGLFPNLKTIWAYDGSAPGAYSGAVPHIMRWERGTAGNTADALDRDSAKHTRKGENVATWTTTQGYDNGLESKPIDQAMQSYRVSARLVEDFRTGERTVENTQQGDLRDHYNNIQRLLSRNDISADQRTELEGQRDFVIRLIYFKNVKTFFQDVHSSTIDTGFKDVDMTPPDFSKMSRKEAFDTVEAFNEKYDTISNPSDTATYLKDLLNNGLIMLSNDHVPSSWI